MDLSAVMLGVALELARRRRARARVLLLVLLGVVVLLLGGAGWCLLPRTSG